MDVDAHKLTVVLKTTVRDALELISETSMKIAIVVDNSNVMLGTITDGDIRRALLRGVELSDTVEKVYHREAVSGSTKDSDLKIRKLMRHHRIGHLPILDEQGRLVKVVADRSFSALSPVKANQVVLMAGGLGERLRPLTEKCHKTMLKVGYKPILEHIIEQFASQQFEYFYISVNYRADDVIEYFGDGSHWGVKIEYLRENERGGTAGSLRLIPEIPKEPFFVMNGDLLTNVNFGRMLDFHIRNNATLTVCTRTYQMEVPYGVLQCDGDRVTKLKEKPVFDFFINAGVYVLSPEVLECIPKGGYFDMTHLLDNLIQKGLNPVRYPFSGYWHDIGRLGDYQRAWKYICGSENEDLSV